MRNILTSIDYRLSLIFKRVISNLSIGEKHEPLALFRIILGVFALIQNTYYGGFTTLPPSLYNPQKMNFIGLWDTVPSDQLIIWLDGLLILLLVALILGIKVRLVSFLVFIITIFLEAYKYSYGKIDHAILYNLTFIVISFCNTGTQYALWKDKPVSDKTQSIAIALFGTVVSFGMFTAGLPKLLSWIDFDLSTSGILRWYYYGYYMSERTFLLAPFFKNIPLVLVELADYIIPLFEVSGLFFLFLSRKYWRIWLVLLCVFHFVTTLILNIPFTIHVIVYSIFLLPYRFPNIKISNVGMFSLIIPISIGLGLNFLLARIMFASRSVFEINIDIYSSTLLWFAAIVIYFPVVLNLENQHHSKIDCSD